MMATKSKKGTKKSTKKKSKKTSKSKEDQQEEKEEKVELIDPALAAAKAFDEVSDLDSANLIQGKRVRDALSTGSLALDLILGGGYKAGMMGTIFGPEASGKSTLIATHLASSQQSNIPGVLYDPETATDPVYLRSVGVDLRFHVKRKVDRKTVTYPGFHYSQPESGEAVYRHILRTLRRLPVLGDGPPEIIFLVDSFEGMASEEVDETGEGGRIADEARMHSYYLKRVVPRLRRRRALFVGTNQMRTDIGTWGSPLREAGGKALRFWPGYKIKTSAKKVEMDKSKVQTLPLVWRTMKNKAFRGLLSIENRIIMGRGIDKAYDAYYFLKNLGLVESGGGRYRILLDTFDAKSLIWKDFRRTVENPRFRATCFEMLRDSSTYVNYFKHSKDATYFYDEDYDFDEAEPELKASMDEEAAEYEELKKSNRKKGKRPGGKSKKEDHADLDLDEESLFGDD